MTWTVLVIRPTEWALLGLLGVALLLLGLAVGLALGRRSGSTATTPAEAAVAQQRDRELAGESAVLRESLERLHDQMRDLEHSRVAWQSRLHQQVDDVRASTETLRHETQALSGALRRPQVRGRWGEMHLRRAVELAGLVERCDFTEQVRLSTPDGADGADAGARRPDLVVHLAGSRSIVVDAKVPLDAFLDSTSATDDEERAVHLARHAAQLRRHVDALAAKAYWRSLPGSPDFVVLFVPAEAFLAAGLDADPSLLEHAAARHVVLASPTTLIGLLRTVALGWSQSALTDQAREVHRLGQELHARLVTFSTHLDQVGRSLNAAVGHYNAAVGSLDTRVLVSARRFGELGVGVEVEEPSAPRTVGLRTVPPRRVAGEDGEPDRRLTS